VTRYEQPLKPAEVRWHGALAAALRLDRKAFTFQWLERALSRMFPEFGPCSNFDFRYAVDPCESTFFSVCCSLHIIEWDSVGDSARIVWSESRATERLGYFCTNPNWAAEGGVWAPEAFHQIVGELRDRRGDE